MYNLNNPQQKSPFFGRLLVVKTGELSNSILTEMLDFIEVIKAIEGGKEE